jgi:hypothetical protein
MSGPGGGGGGGGGGRPPIEPVPNCELIERTQVNSPKAGVIKHIQVNDVLTVKLLTEAGQKLLVAETDRGETAGSLTPRHLPELIRCIQAGHRYIAVVLRVLGGIVEVEVRPAAQRS